MRSALRDLCVSFDSSFADIVGPLVGNDPTARACNTPVALARKVREVLDQSELKRI